MKQYIKIFSDDNLAYVQEEVDEFLDELDNNINVIHQSTIYGDGLYVLTITYSKNVSINKDKI